MRHTGKKHLAISLLLFWAMLQPAVSLLAQHTTRQESDETKQPLPSPELVKKKVLLVPLDPKMYLSDIDRSFNRETKMSYAEIRDAIRFGINRQLFSSFKTGYSVISLLKDTSKSRKDLDYIYHSIGYKYTETQPVKGRETAEQEKAVDKGQLKVRFQDESERYMRTVIRQPGLVTAMNKKYGADLFVFVGEVDLKSVISATGPAEREALLHYTVFDLEGKQVCGGLARARFPADQNDPRKISSRVFPQMAGVIYDRVRALSPPLPEKKPVPGTK